MTLYGKIESDLMARIQSGEWPVGMKLPPENELAASMGVSRATLRMAFSQLERQGILQRRKRAGTTIVSDTPRTQFHQQTGGLHSVLALADSTQLTVLKVLDVADSSAECLEGHHSATGHWLAVTGERTMPGDARPFAFTEVYVTGAYAGVRPLINNDVRSVYTLIQERFGITVSRLRQSARAVACPERATQALGLSAGDPCLQIVAELLDSNDQVIEITSTWFHPEKFEVESDVSINH